MEITEKDLDELEAYARKFPQDEFNTDEWLGVIALARKGLDYEKIVNAVVADFVGQANAVTYPPEMLPSPDEGQEADVIVEKEDATDRREGLRLSGTDNDANVHGVSSRHDDCGDPGCCPDNPLTPMQGLVERLRLYADSGLSLDRASELLREAAAALERMNTGWKACRESLWAARADLETIKEMGCANCAPTRAENKALRAENDLICKWNIDAKAEIARLRAENERLRDGKATVTRIMNERNETVMRLRAALEKVVEFSSDVDEDSGEAIDPGIAVVNVQEIARSALAGDATLPSSSTKAQR